MKHVHFHSNSFYSVTYQVSNPLRVDYSQASTAKTWGIGASGELPFNGQVRNVDSLVIRSAIKNASNQTVFSLPYIETQLRGRPERD